MYTNDSVMDTCARTHTHTHTHTHNRWTRQAEKQGRSRYPCQRAAAKRRPGECAHHGRATPAQPPCRGGSAPERQREQTSAPAPASTQGQGPQRRQGHQSELHERRRWELQRFARPQGEEPHREGRHQPAYHAPNTHTNTHAYTHAYTHTQTQTHTLPGRPRSKQITTIFRLFARGEGYLILDFTPVYGEYFLTLGFEVAGGGGRSSWYTMAGL